MGVIRLLRRASLACRSRSAGDGLAIMAGMLGTAEAMFLVTHDLRVVVMVCVVAAVVAIGFGGLLGRQVEASSLALRQAAVRSATRTAVTVAGWTDDGRARGPVAGTRRHR